MATQHGTWYIVTAYMHRRHGAGWPRNEKVRMMSERKCQCGGWMDMFGEEGIWNSVELRRRLTGLESHRGQVWDEVLGMVGRYLGGCHRYSYNCV
jgi:hypothetical protein